MCRLLAYLGAPIQLERLLYDPQHSLVVQSYQPKEMTGGLLNADGFGVGWYGATPAELPYSYRHTLPIWNDVNLPPLSRYIRSHCIVANVRSATPGLAVDLSNCQPFQHRSLSVIHNGYIDRFRKTLFRPIRNQLSDLAYEAIRGTTDSEHMFGLLIDAYEATQDLALALQRMIRTMLDLATEYQTDFSANFIVTDGQVIVAARYANRDPVPSLYWLRPSPADNLPDSILIASEPFFEGNWQPFVPRSMLVVKPQAEASALAIQTIALDN
jgi:ergothioneine biosynthesis protein EgtC